LNFVLSPAVIRQVQKRVGYQAGESNTALPLSGAHRFSAGGGKGKYTESAAVKMRR